MIVSNALKTLVGAIPFAVVVLFGDDPGRLEGRFFPVAKNYQVISTEAADDGITVDLLFQKVRDCKFKGLDFYILNHSMSWIDVPVASTSDPAKLPYSRPLGDYEVSWKLNASKSLVSNPMKVVTHHVCWGLIPWDVETVSYLSR